ncbi:MAG: hypothetical protein HY868_14765 [Chloroflexi bacterium]|nr:hypothetical protein [Chloroflexota bacterium]
MPDRKNDVPVRPVDALFGDSGATHSPSYVVEPPQPVADVTPPVVDNFPEPVPHAPVLGEHVTPREPETEWMPPLPTARADEPAPLFEPATRAMELPQLAPREEATPAESEFEMPAPTYTPRSDERFAADLSFRIERLYDDVKMDLPDSPVVARECMLVLRDARDAFLKRDYATAEYLAQMVDARLKRSIKSIRTAKSPAVLGLWAWQVVALLLFGGLLAVTFIQNLTLFGLPVAGELIAFLRVLAWGAIGGVLGGTYNLLWYLQHRDYDPAFNVSYFVRPFLGALVGAILFLGAQAFLFTGIVASSSAKPGDVAAGSAVLYLVTVFAGFKLDDVIEYVDGLSKALMRGSKSSRPPSA